MSDRPPRPDPLAVDVDGIPEDARDREQWVCWRYEFDPDRDEWTKVPVDVATGGYASSTDPDTWSTFGAAVAYHDRDDRDTDGLGFMLAPDDTVLGLDLDDCRDPAAGVIEPWAEAIIDDVASYAEVSPSGTGIHVLAHGFLPDGGNRADVDGAEGHLELYDRARYLTVTGQRLEDAPAEVCPANDAVATVHAEHIADDGDTGGEEAGSGGSNPGGSAGGSGSGDVDLDDAELIERAKAAENGDYFADLWEGRWERHTDRWPSWSPGQGQSEADLALASLLAWWTGGDRSRTDRLFRRSDLCQDREKWNRDDYREATLDAALSTVGTGYDPPTDGDGNDGVSVPPPEELIAEIEAGERSYADGGATAEEAESGSSGDAGPGGESYVVDELSPDAVVTLAGLAVDDDETAAQALADLTDREAAAYVWELAKRTERVHVVVRRDNGELWAWDPETGVWEPEGERTLRHAARQALGSINYGKNVLEELKAQARADPAAEIGAEALGVMPGQLAVANGLLDLEAAADGAGDDALRELRPSDYALARLPVEYDPDAESERWREFVDEVAEDGMAPALQEYVGYCLEVGRIPIHRALLLVGTGANGKGTFLTVVRALLGEENTTSIELQTLANERDAVAEFYGALANIDDDLSARKLGKGLGMFKKLVAGDRVRARHLYESGFEFQATGKHLYAANQVPDVSENVDDDDDAFWRRWLLVEFPNYYPPGDRDPQLPETLTEPEALSAVLNWAIEGRARLLERGRFTGEKEHPQEKRERWQAWGDSVDKFVAECVERDEDADRLTTGEAHQRFSAWCRKHGLPDPGQRTLTNRLKSENVGYNSSLRVDGHSTPQRGYAALGLSDDVPELDDTPDRERDGEQSRLGR